MKKLENLSQYEELLQTEKVVLMFSADWCPDCRVIEPILPEIEEEFNEFQFYYVDRDQFIELCQSLEIYGIPSFVAFDKGQELGRFVSKDRKTKEEIVEFLKGLYNKRSFL
ncbi:thioredoxin family protein [Litchfieldia salsa]|uniref:Thiol-disulfide isomerase or thioredoxin n=1 Tax=Litchfieldia salsa TaxID=930152 RepID=A0A1H0P7R2_9BACI|nr:thioredoxin family protein [Litchfieldia salsa]SDP00758.1 Thiol-disulfide isomerase or thioredoxin [Litchfieldia salsa]